MFESIVSKITNVIRAAARSIGAAMRKNPWLAPLAIVGLVLVW